VGWNIVDFKRTRTTTYNPAGRVAGWNIVEWSVESTKSTIAACE
jgi:hypothetical protein